MLWSISSLFCSLVPDPRLWISELNSEPNVRMLKLTSADCLHYSLQLPSFSTETCLCLRLEDRRVCLLAASRPLGWRWRWRDAETFGRLCFLCQGPELNLDPHEVAWWTFVFSPFLFSVFESNFSAFYTFTAENLCLTCHILILRVSVRVPLPRVTAVPQTNSEGRFDHCFWDSRDSQRSSSPLSAFTAPLAFLGFDA